jgi:hypothetical protein
VAASPKRVPIVRRAQLGSPDLSVSTSGTYLRHRAAADQAYRARQRALRRNRLIISVIALLFYFLIGRDLLALLGAKKNDAATEVRKDAQQITKDVSNIARSNRLASDQNIPQLDLTSAGANARKDDPSDVDALFTKQPAGR